MLVLTRKVDEVITIGDNISIVIVRISGDQVRIGIEAPKHIPVHRLEVLNRIQQEKEAKAGKATDGE